MNLLWICDDVPFARMYGGSIDLSNRVQGVARRGHRIHLLAWSRDAVGPEVHAKLRSLTTAFAIVTRPRGMKFALSPVPYSCATRDSQQARDLVRAWAAETRFDLVHFDSTHAGALAPLVRAMGLPYSVRVHNIERSFFRQQSKATANPVRKLAFRLEAAKLDRFEPALFREAAALVPVSTTEAEQLRAELPSVPVLLVGSAVHGEPGPRPAGATTMAGRILFSGTMSLPHNEEAVLWFAQEVFPRVQAGWPEASFVVAGRSPSPAVQRLAERAGVEVTGEVPDMGAVLRAADVVVAPVLHGAGIKVKVLEAALHGKPMVATPHAVEGTPFVAGVHLRCEATPARFADAVLDALRDPAGANRMAQAAYDLVVGTYCEPAVGDAFEAALAVAAKGSRGPARRRPAGATGP